jgi:hypothetical protein
LFFVFVCRQHGGKSVPAVGRSAKITTMDRPVLWGVSPMWDFCKSEFLSTRQMRLNEQLKAALHHCPDSFGKLSINRTTLSPCGREGAPVLKWVLPPVFFYAPIPIRPLELAWGKHPLVFYRARRHSILAFMSTDKMTKAVFGKANRSGFHYFVTPVLPRKRTSETGFDILGGVMVASLSAGGGAF